MGFGYFALLLFITTSVVAHESTHWYVTSSDLEADSLKTVYTLQRPYDLITFIKQSERLEQIDNLQFLVKLIGVKNSNIKDKNGEGSDDESEDETLSNGRRDEQYRPECSKFIKNGESLTLKLLRTNLYETLHIQFSMKQINLKHYFRNQTLGEDSIQQYKNRKLHNCRKFCQLDYSMLAFDHLPGIQSRFLYSKKNEHSYLYDDVDVLTEDIEYFIYYAYEQLQNKNSTSWIAYTLMSYHFYYKEKAYKDSIDCLRCALYYMPSSSEHADIPLIALANVLYHYGHIKDSIVLIEKTIDNYHRIGMANSDNGVQENYLLSLTHYYLANMYTIENKFYLALKHYNKTIYYQQLILNSTDVEDEDTLYLYPYLIDYVSKCETSHMKYDALECHLSLEQSLQHKHQLLQTKLKQLNQLKDITDELIRLNTLIKRDMSTDTKRLQAKAFLLYLKKQKHHLCKWGDVSTRDVSYSSITHHQQRSTSYINVMLESKFQCFKKDENKQKKVKLYELDCKPLRINENEQSEMLENGTNSKPNNVELRLQANFDSVKETKSIFIAPQPLSTTTSTAETDLFSTKTSFQINDGRFSSTIQTTSIMNTNFSLSLYPELYPANMSDDLVVESVTTTTTVTSTLSSKYSYLNPVWPSYEECQIHYQGLPDIGEYPSVWLPFENKGFYIKKAFYDGMQLKSYSHKHSLPWSPPLCCIREQINEQSPHVLKYDILKKSSRLRAPLHRPDYNMLLTLYYYIDTTIDEQIPPEEFGQRILTVYQLNLLPSWILYTISSLYWRVNGNLQHALDCALKSLEYVPKNYSDVTLINLANILYLWGKYEDALDITLEAYSVNSNEPITNFFLGNLLSLTKQNYSGAISHYQHALEVDSDHIYSKRYLRVIKCYLDYKIWLTDFKQKQFKEQQTATNSLTISQSISTDDLLDDNDEKKATHDDSKENENDDEKYQHQQQQQRESSTTKSEDKQCPGIDAKTCNLMAYKKNTHLAAPLFRGSRSSSVLKITTNTNIPISLPALALLDDSHALTKTWLNRSILKYQQNSNHLSDEARRHYKNHHLCVTDVECSYGFFAIGQSDIAHIQIVYDDYKEEFHYNFLFSNDYESMFKQGEQQCIIYGTGRKSQGCRQRVLKDHNDVNPSHRQMWWRDQSTIYEYLKELIEHMTYTNEIKNKSITVPPLPLATSTTNFTLNNTIKISKESIVERMDQRENSTTIVTTSLPPSVPYELTDDYLLSYSLQYKYLLNKTENNEQHSVTVGECLKQFDTDNLILSQFNQYLSAWISPQTKGIQMTTYLKQLLKIQPPSSLTSIPQYVPYCSPFKKLKSNNSTTLEYIFDNSQNLTQFHSEPVLKHILLSAMYGSQQSHKYTWNETSKYLYKAVQQEHKTVQSNSSWLLYNIVSLYWRIQGNGQAAIDCLLQSYELSPQNVKDLSLVSIAHVYYNSQLYLNEALYILYEALKFDKKMLLVHFSIGNILAKKQKFIPALKWYESTLELKSDFQPARKRIHALNCILLLDKTVRSEQEEEDDEVNDILIMSTLLKKLFRKTKFRSRSRSATKLSSSVPENCESDKPSNTQQRSVNRCQTVDTCQRFDRQTVINRQQSVSPRSSNRTSKYSLCKRAQHCAFINDDRLVCTSEQNSQCKICLKWFCKLHLQTHEYSPVRMKCKMTVHYQSPNDCSKVYNNAYSGIHDSVNVIDDTITNKVAECYPHTHQTVINRVTTELLGLVDYLDTFDKLKMADRRLDSRQQELNEIIRELKEYRNNSADIRQKLMKILEHEPDDSKQLRQLIENVENLKVKLYDYQQQLSMTAKEETVETNTRQKDSKTNTTAIVHVQKKEKNKMSTIDLVQRKPIQHFKCEKTVNGANLAATSYAV
ncbi:unnamed protein product [Didymodactylos carnosus]|uniref:Tetratricopeptide repeat protein 17 n=1 Tax=Didymodactylos carnosus TaxID=1234261 RepID=A0A8S2HLS6_9BILA|nr:unnamed protein product [Didymodactylos carnosus]CAF3660376.1 unnamed protein product [Didymodactylos carnosus]